MTARRPREPDCPQSEENLREKAFSFKTSKALYHRMDAYLKLQHSRVKSKTDLVEIAIIEFLDKEEPIAKEIEKIRNRLERGGGVKA